MAGFCPLHCHDTKQFAGPDTIISGPRATFVALADILCFIDDETAVVDPGGALLGASMLQTSVCMLKAASGHAENKHRAGVGSPPRDPSAGYGVHELLKSSLY